MMRDTDELTIIENTITKEFKKFINKYNRTRRKIQNQNTRLKNLFYSKNSLVPYSNDYGIFIKDDLDMTYEIFYYEFNTFILNNSLFIPEGIFCFPVNENIRTDEQFELKFMVKIENFAKFEEIIENTKQSFDEWYSDYPHNKDEFERIDNKSFLVWAWIKSLIKIYSKFGNIEKGTCQLIQYLSKIISKNFSVVYKELSNYLNNIIDKKIVEKNKYNYPKISSYRQLYCQICYKYLCNLHFYKLYNFKNIQETKIFKSELTKNSGTVKYLTATNFSEGGDYEKGNLNFEKFHSCELITNCKLNYEMINGVFNNLTSVPSCRVYNFKDNEIQSKSQSKSIMTSHEYYFILFDEIFDPFDFYLLNCILSSKILSNSCYISKYVFNGKYKCHAINKIIQILQDKFMINLVDEYLQNKLVKNSKVSKSFRLNFPLISKEKLKLNYLNDVTLKKCKIPNTNSVLSINYIKKAKCEYTPCSHPGLCKKENCECIFKRGYCDKFCNCRDYCENKFKGCNCTDGCKNSQYKSKCVCVNEHRECDPDICHFCGASTNFPEKKEFNSINSINNIIDKHGLCKNMSMNFKLYKKTCLSKSILCNYYGLFALEDIEENEYICEYSGELLSKEETDRRSVFNDQLGLNYLFGLSDSSDIDAYRLGSKMRYVNHSSHGYQNCYARANFVRGVYRIALFALRNIKKGEELYFDYMIKVNVPWLMKYDRYYSSKK